MLVCAGGGYGKSLAAAEYAAALDGATVELTLRRGDEDELVRRLVAALKRAGLSDAATAVREESADPAAAVDALIEALERESEPMLLTVDDVHNAGADAAKLLGRLAAALAPAHRLLLLGRTLPPPLDTLLISGEHAFVPAEELAFTADETTALCGHGFGVTLEPEQSELLVRATAGWAAAIVLMAERLARAGDPRRELHEMVDQGTLLAHLVRQALAELDHDARAAALELGHLPFFSPAVADAVAGGRAPDLLEQVAAAGLPISQRADGWSEFPGPVQEVLAGLGPLERETAQRVAARYAAEGEVHEAVHILLGAGDADSAADLLAALSPQQADELGYSALQLFVDLLPAAALARRPDVLVHLARTCEPAAQTRVREAALARVRTLASGGDPRLTRAVDAEQARDLVRDDRAEEAESLATRVLAEVGPDELATRARLLDVLGRTAAWRRDDESLIEAERLLEEARVLCRRLGQRSWDAQVLLPLAHGVYFARGHHDQALDRIEQVLVTLPSRSSHRGVILAFYGDILVDCGRFAEAEAAVDEARQLGALLGDRRVSAYAAWTSARLASQTGDAQRTLDEVRAVEAERDDWFAHSTGVDFLADAADLLDRVGQTTAAARYLERARARRDEAPLAVAIAEAAVLARSGDPAEAERSIGQILELARLEPRERWRISLLSAYAALRQGDPRAGALAAEAFERAAALKQPILPLVREPAVAERLVGLAAASGSPAAEALLTKGLPLVVATLGGFDVRRGGRPLALPPGKPAQLVKLLCAVGGRAHAEQVIEELWPEVEPASGRKRLRNVLNRLRHASADLILREGETLTLGTEVEIDARLFERETRRALEAAASQSPEAPLLARAALARYAGPFLPDDLYEPWTAASRERLAECFLDLLDVVAAAAEEKGEFDEAVRLLERALELDPIDEVRYLRAVRLSLAQGRRGRAAALLARAERTLDELSIPPSAAHLELAETVRT